MQRITANLDLVQRVRLLSREFHGAKTSNKHSEVRRGADYEKVQEAFLKAGVFETHAHRDTVVNVFPSAVGEVRVDPDQAEWEREAWRLKDAERYYEHELSAVFLSIVGRRTEADMSIRAAGKRKHFYYYAEAFPPPPLFYYIQKTVHPFVLCLFLRSICT
jgi:hypothetical protein